jgi:membrane protease YdiL (CAAX protease family)
MGVLLLVFGTVLFSLRVGAAASAAHASPRLAGYLFTIAGEWLVFFFIWLGSRWGGASLRTLAGDFAPTWRSILRDLGLALAFLIVANIVLALESSLLTRFLQAPSKEALRAFLPQRGAESAVFLLLTITAGISEETIFRGYLQRQFTVWTKSAALGIALQGILFGAYHAPLGLISVITNAVCGALLYGTLAAWRRSLRPGMIAHTLGDAVGGLVLARYFLK